MDAKEIRGIPAIGLDWDIDEATATGVGIQTNFFLREIAAQLAEINAKMPFVVTEVVSEGMDPSLPQFKMSVDQLEISIRAYNCLRHNEINTVGELVTWTRKDLLKTRNFGKLSISEIEHELVKMGLSLGMKYNKHGRLIS
jgi:DNA-directed RNA polymerase alpha subunit